MTQNTPTSKGEEQMDSIVGDRFACHILRMLYNRGAMSKRDVVDSLKTSRRSLYTALDRLIGMGYVETFNLGPSVHLTDRGMQVAELLTKMEAIEQEGVRIIEGAKLEEGVKAVFAVAVGRSFPSDLSIASMVNAIMREAYPNEKYVPAERPPYHSEIDVRKPCKGRIGERTDVIERYLDMPGDLSDDLKGSVEVEMELVPSEVKDKENIWRIAAEMKQKKEMERNQRMYALLQNIDEIDEELEELAEESADPAEIGSRFKILSISRRMLQKQVDELNDEQEDKEQP